MLSPTENNSIINETASFKEGVTNKKKKEKQF